MCQIRFGFTPAGGGRFNVTKSEEMSEEGEVAVLLGREVESAHF